MENPLRGVVCLLTTGVLIRVGRLSFDAGLNRKLCEEIVCVCIDGLNLPTCQELRPYLIVEADRKSLSRPLLSISPNSGEQVSYMLVSKAVAHKKNGIVLK